MKLVAIYIQKHQLTHIFGEHDGITINLGGKYFYNFDIENKINREENKRYINDFWGGISLVSTIVGANGSGKTTILRLLVKEFKSNPDPRQCVFIYEDNDNKTHILNETKLELKSDFEFTLIDTKKYSENILYYSPNLDYNLQSIHSEISLVNYHISDLESYNLNSIRRHLFFLKNEELINILKKSYDDFPFYNEIELKAKPLYKSDFEKDYIQATIGNKYYKVRNILLDKAKYSENKKLSLNEDQINDVFNNTSTIQDELKALWDSYKNIDKSKSQYLHDGNDFIKNVEVNILSYLVLKDTFSIDGDYGSHPFFEILKMESFKDKLTQFLHKFIIQSSNILYGFVSPFINLDNIKELKNKVSTSINPKKKFEGVEFERKIKVIINKIDLIESVFIFYSKLQLVYEKEESVKNEGSLKFKITSFDINLFNDLINSYEKLLLHIKIDNFKLNGVLQINTTKKLSTGEKSLIDMYASFYDYLKRWGNKEYMYPENCILLLDEPEQGYHPLWKKKFVKAISSSFPELIKVNQKIKSLQIIFTTHDPLTLSDIPSDNIVFLDKEVLNGKSLTIVKNKEQIISKTFGANIHDLLANSFFLQNGFMGEYAETMIKDLIVFLDKENQKGTKIVWTEDKAKKLIDTIDEPFIKQKLLELYNKKYFESEKIVLLQKMNEIKSQIKLLDEKNKNN